MSGEVRAPRPIHPFPARMAPETFLDRCRAFPASSVVLDPMAGSGTVVRVAADLGHRAVGFDLDPLSVLLARVWTSSISAEDLRIAADRIVAECTTFASSPSVDLPWIDDDPPTLAFTNYWFADCQRRDLRRLSASVARSSGHIGDALRVALSRIIITKDRGASLARDVSHSRPHRSYTSNDFEVIPSFARSVRFIASRLEAEPPSGTARVARGDARSLHMIKSQSIDAIVTSPPYLNAIDYLRGHRLALVWLGFNLSELRRIRASSIGAERAPDGRVSSNVIDDLSCSLGPVHELAPRYRAIAVRYVIDILAMLSEMARVLRPNGTAILVVGNSSLRGVFLNNASLVVEAADRVGLQFVESTERQLPPNRRYLPPPVEAPHTSTIQNRLRTESVLHFNRTQ